MDRKKEKITTVFMLVNFDINFLSDNGMGYMFLILEKLARHQINEETAITDVKLLVKKGMSVASRNPDGFYFIDVMDAMNLTCNQLREAVLSLGHPNRASQS
ncbi:hypothetical protein BGZ63DRAFT_383604 [Mariannaea sp. PMI_226]|nr:hypothetical protein BGZ63DRAFT_383604 [Mariannaea sp. PMI_226]